MKREGSFKVLCTKIDCACQFHSQCNACWANFIVGWYHKSTVLYTYILLSCGASVAGITKMWTGLENAMENGTENGLVEDLTVICLSK